MEVYGQEMIPRNQSSAVSGQAVAADLPALFHQLVRLEIELWRSVDARLLADCGLSLGRFEVMRVVSRRSPCRVQDIADELSITVGGVSKLVDRIQAAGHCRRRPNPGDKRSSVIELTPAGEQLVATANRSFEDELNRLFGSIPAAALRQFSTTITRLRSTGRGPDTTEGGPE
jgi:DNA-binding MarR family transcriptional regulator